MIALYLTLRNVLVLSAIPYATLCKICFCTPVCLFVVLLPFILLHVLLLCGQTSLYLSLAVLVIKATKVWPQILRIPGAPPAPPHHVLLPTPSPSRLRKSLYKTERKTLFVRILRLNIDKNSKLLQISILYDVAYCYSAVVLSCDLDCRCLEKSYYRRILLEGRFLSTFHIHIGNRCLYIVGRRIL